MVTETFRSFASRAASWMGSPWAFLTSFILVVVWAASGFLFDFGEGWQLIANTVTTIITFLMVFLLQSSQNKDTKAIHLKLDELVRSGPARNAFADLEDASEEEIDRFAEEFREFRARRKGREGAG